MSDEQYLRDIETAAASLGSGPSDYDALRSLLASLPPGTAPTIRSAGVGAPTDESAAGAGGVGGNLTMQSSVPIGTESGSGIGSYPQLYYGKTNLLLDPVITRCRDIFSTLPSVAAPNASDEWQTWKEVVSGATPSFSNSWHDGYYYDDYHPMGSNLRTIFTGTTAGAATTDYMFSVRTPLAAVLGWPFLLAAIKVIRNDFFNPTDYTSCELFVELWDSGSGGSLVYGSLPLDLIDFHDGSISGETKLLACIATDAHVAPPLYMRVRIRTVAPAAAGGTRVSFGDPQLTYSATQAPPPYSPILGRWIPAQVRGYSNVNQDPVLEAYRINLNTFPALSIEVDGDFEWGDGATDFDVVLQRTAASEMTWSKDRFGAVMTTKHIGPLFVQGPDSMDLAVIYGAFGPTSVTRTDGALISTTTITYDGSGNVTGVVTTRFGKTYTLTPAYTGPNITSLHRAVT